MTSVEGDDIIGGGMEFPMLTLIGAYRERGADALYGVTLHELAHIMTWAEERSTDTGETEAGTTRSCR
jgi:hypothetical protein